MTPLNLIELLSALGAFAIMYSLVVWALVVCFRDVYGRTRIDEWVSVWRQYPEDVAAIEADRLDVDSLRKRLRIKPKKGQKP